MGTKVTKDEEFKVLLTWGVGEIFATIIYEDKSNGLGVGTTMEEAISNAYWSRLKKVG